MAAFRYKSRLRGGDCSNSTTIYFVFLNHFAYVSTASVILIEPLWYVFTRQWQRLLLPLKWHNIHSITRIFVFYILNIHCS